MSGGISIRTDIALRRQLRPAWQIKNGKRARIKRVPINLDGGDKVIAYRYISYEVANSRSIDRSREPNVQRVKGNNHRKVFA